MYRHDFFLETNLENDSSVEFKQEDLHDVANSLIEANLIITWQTEIQIQDEKLVRFHLGVSANDADPEEILNKLKQAAEKIDFFNITLTDDHQNNNSIKLR